MSIANLSPSTEHDEVDRHGVPPWSNGASGTGGMGGVGGMWGVGAGSTGTDSATGVKLSTTGCGGGGGMDGKVGVCRTRATWARGWH